MRLLLGHSVLLSLAGAIVEPTHVCAPQLMTRHSDMGTRQSALLLPVERVRSRFSLAAARFDPEEGLHRNRKQLQALRGD